MPFQPRACQQGDLCLSFLNVILAEGPLSGSGQSRDSRRSLGLGNRQQLRHWPMTAFRRVFKGL
jgi:hypothetical protein